MGCRQESGSGPGADGQVISRYDRFLAERVLGARLGEEAAALAGDAPGPVLVVLTTQQDPLLERRWNVVMDAMRKAPAFAGRAMVIHDVADRSPYDLMRDGDEPLVAAHLAQALETAPAAAVMLSLMGLPESPPETPLSVPFLVYDGRALPRLDDHPARDLARTLVAPRPGIDFQTVQDHLAREADAFDRYFLVSRAGTDSTPRPIP